MFCVHKKQHFRIPLRTAYCASLKDNMFAFPGKIVLRLSDMVIYLFYVCQVTCFVLCRQYRHMFKLQLYFCYHKTYGCTYFSALYCMLRTSVGPQIHALYSKLCYQSA
jgi:hypothetical protein